MIKKTVMMGCLLLAQAYGMAAAPLPKDVAKFVERREGCDHFRGEIPEATDPDRMDDINRELKKLCKGTDRKLLQLKQKYAANTAVTAVLAQFEPNIEPAPRQRMQ
jgi:hypothetical protein